MRIKIQHKITFVFIIISAVILFSLFIYLSNNLKENTYKRIKTNVIKQLELAKSYIEDIPISNISSYEVDSIVDKIGHDLGLRVTFIGMDGKVYGDSELKVNELSEVENHLYRPEIQQAIKSGLGQSHRFSTTVKKDFLYTAALLSKDKSQGIIRLSIPLSEIEELLSSLTKTLEIVLLFAFIFSGLVSSLASFFISRPIRTISWAAKDIAQGNYTRKISIQSHDEIGDLGSAFNYMSEQIKIKIEEVSQGMSRLEAVFLSMFEGVMIVDTSGIILLMNQALKDVMKIEEDPLGKKPIEVMRNLQIQEIVDNIFELKSNLISKEISTLLPEEKILLVHATRIEKDQHTEGVVLVFHDVTTLRNLEKVRKDFVANVSHELRTPISSIKGFAETLLAGALDDKENSKDFLKIILSDSNRLACLIDDLLNLSKIESGKLIMERKPCGLLEIVEKVIASLKVQLEFKSIITKISIPQDLPNVLVDETRIKQVLLNLIDNAIKYNMPSGEILILAKEIDSFVRVDIVDTGIGIPSNNLPRLFERFYRVDKARSRELGGTGLGLAIVKHIVQSHSGEVLVESVELQGSTFSFTIPKA